MDQTAGKASSQYGGGSSGGGGWEGRGLGGYICMCVCVCHSEPSLTFTGPKTGDTERERGWWGVLGLLIATVSQSWAPIYMLGLAAGHACHMIWVLWPLKGPGHPQVHAQTHIWFNCKFKLVVQTVLEMIKSLAAVLDSHLIFDSPTPIVKWLFTFKYG